MSSEILMWFLCSEHIWHWHKAYKPRLATECSTQGSNGQVLPPTLAKSMKRGHRHHPNNAAYMSKSLTCAQCIVEGDVHNAHWCAKSHIPSLLPWACYHLSNSSQDLLLCRRASKQLCEDNGMPPSSAKPDQRRPSRLELLSNALSHAEPATDVLPNPSLAVIAEAREETVPTEPVSNQVTYARLQHMLYHPDSAAAATSEGQQPQPPADMQASPTLPVFSASLRDAKPYAASNSPVVRSPAHLQQISRKQMLATAAELPSSEHVSPSAVANLLPAEATDARHDTLVLPTADQKASLSAMSKLAKVRTGSVITTSSNWEWLLCLIWTSNSRQRSGSRAKKFNDLRTSLASRVIWCSCAYSSSSRYHNVTMFGSCKACFNVTTFDCQPFWFWSDSAKIQACVLLQFAQTDLTLSKPAVFQPCSCWTQVVQAFCCV